MPGSGKRLAILGALGIAAFALMLLATPREQTAKPSAASGLEKKRGQTTFPVRERLSDPVSSPDLPPEGTRSLFDHLLKDNGGLPGYFDKLIDLVARHDAEGRRPAAVLIPDGRSLLKGQASFARPRIVVAADVRPAASEADFGFLLKGRLFLGFVEDAREIEVISYNEAAGRYEFQVVRDYAEGGVPRITYAKRSLCTTCHQGGAPIFPVRPWDETNAQPGIAEKIRHARGVSAGAEYFGVAIDGRLESAETIDDLVTLANVIPVTQRIWIDGCGDDAVKGGECRREMLLLALRFLRDPADVSPESAEAKKLIALQRESWPKSGIAVPNPSLLNRNPLEEASGGFLARLESALAAKLRREAPAGLDQLAPVRPELDPLRPRAAKTVLAADTLEGAYGVAALFGPNDWTYIEQASGGDFSKVERALRSERLTPAFIPNPFRRVAFLEALLTELGVKDLPASSGESTEGMSLPLAEGGKPLRIAAGSPLEPFERYCFACHRGNPAAKLDFMSGDSEDQVLAKIKQVSEIRDVLDYERYLGTKKESRLMPPPGSTQRAELDRVRAAGKDDVKRMIDQIPGLFE